MVSVLPFYRGVVEGERRDQEDARALVSHVASLSRAAGIRTIDPLDDLRAAVRAKVDPACAVRCVPYAEAYGPDFEDLQRRVPDLARLRELLGAVPMRGLDEIIERAVAYARATPE